MAYINLNYIKNQVKKENLQVCVVSYGGSGTNTLMSMLEQNGYVTNTKIWRKILCHCPHYVDMGIPIIYVYNDPTKSFQSMKRRGKIWIKNQRKLSNNKFIEFSNEMLLKLMIKQFKSWTQIKRKDVLVVKTSELFEDGINKKLQNFLNKTELEGFPIPYVEPKTKYNEIPEQFSNLFDKYKKDIEYINKFSFKPKLILKKKNKEKPNKKPNKKPKQNTNEKSINQ